MISRCSILYRCVEVCSVYFDYCFQAFECGKSAEHLRTLRSKARDLDPAIRGATEKYRSYRMENSLNSACSKTLTDRVLENRSLWSAEARLPAVPLRPFGTSGAAAPESPRRAAPSSAGEVARFSIAPPAIACFAQFLARAPCLESLRCTCKQRGGPGACPARGPALLCAAPSGRLRGNGQAPHPPTPPLTDCPIRPATRRFEAVAGPGGGAGAGSRLYIKSRITRGRSWVPPVRRLGAAAPSATHPLDAAGPSQPPPEAAPAVRDLRRRPSRAAAPRRLVGTRC